MSQDIDEAFQVADSSNLTDADWAEINNLKALYVTGGKEALSERMNHLALNEPARYLTVWGAIFPDMIKEAVKDSMAAHGMDDDDLRELMRNQGSPARRDQ